MLQQQGNPTDVGGEQQAQIKTLIENVRNILLGKDTIKKVVRNIQRNKTALHLVTYKAKNPFIYQLLFKFQTKSGLCN